MVRPAERPTHTIEVILTTRDETPLRWELTDHCCRICFARILTRTTFDSRKIFRCSNCDTEVESQQVTGLCCCGMKLRTNRDAGVRCQVSTDRSPENPSYIVAAQIDPQIATRK